MRAPKETTVALLLALANAARAFADTLEDELRDTQSPAPPSPKPKKKAPRKRAPAPVRPEREPSEADRARARAALRRVGHIVKEPGK